MVPSNRTGGGPVREVSSPSKPPSATMSENSLARFSASLIRLGLALIVGIITARVLGPAGKGALSSLLFLAEVVLGLVATLGLEEAALVLIGQRRATPQQVVSGSIIPIVFGSVAALLGLVVVSYLADWEAIRVSVIVAGVSAAIWGLLRLAIGVLNAQERIVTTQGALVVGAGVTAVATYGLLVGLDGGFLGAVAAAALGALAALVLLARALRRQGVRLSVRWDPALLREALPLGGMMQASQLLVSLSLRFDLLIVYALTTEAIAGHYSVALTGSQAVGGIGAALSMSTFPRISGLPPDPAYRLTAQTARLAFVGGVLVAAPLAVAIPFATVPLFGEDFRPVIPLALGLLPAGVMWGTHWVVARSEAARGKPGLLLASFSLSVLVMVAMDVILLPLMGAAGAVVATGVASTSGLIASIWWLHRATERLTYREFVPRMGDLRMVFTLARRLASGMHQRVRSRG